jgi:hypothetical protein
MRPLRLLTSSAALTAALFAGAAAVMAAGLVTVTPQNMNGWLIQASGTSSGAFVEGPGTPLAGTGSFRMSVGPNGDDTVYMRTGQYAGMSLSELNELSYSTYVEEGNGTVAPYIILEIDFNNDDVRDDVLFFEPAYQNGTYQVNEEDGGTVANQCGDNPTCVTNDTWQTWNAADGGWWSGNDGTGGPPLRTLDGYAAIHTGATLMRNASGALRLSAGGGAGPWNGFVGSVDNVQVTFGADETTFDFETGDRDQDTIRDDIDNCPSIDNTNQLNSDADATGDACDEDDDNDTIPDATDNCDLTSNVGQGDADQDNVGDACDATPSYVVVTQQQLNGWTITGGATGTGNFVRGPAVPPLGVGSFQFTLGGSGSDATQIRHDATGTGRDLSDLNMLSYATYVATGSGETAESPCEAPVLVLVVDNGEGDDTLTYDPCDQETAVTRDAWQTWNAMNGEWNTGGEGSETLQEYMEGNEDRDITSFGVDASVDEEDETITMMNTDAFRIGFTPSSGTTYDFEPDDRDNDQIGDATDNCPAVANANQADVDQDGQGDVCDNDSDNDGLPNATDNCPLVSNPAQFDTDADGIGDDCDNNTTNNQSSSAANTGGGGGGGGGGGRRPTGTVAPGGFGGISSSSRSSSASSRSRTTFPDVEQGSFYEEAVEDFLEHGYLDSNQSRFRPADASTRAELTKLVIELNGGILNDSPDRPSFDDVRPGTWYYDYMEDAGTRTWVRGDNNCYGRHPCTARPNDTVTRAEAAAIIVRTYDYEITNEAPKFADVSTNQWYAQWIQIAADHCILRGDGGGTNVRPHANVTRAELVVMLDRAQDNTTYENGCRQTGTQGRITSVNVLSDEAFEVSFNIDIPESSALDDDRFIVNCDGLVRTRSTERVDNNTVRVNLEDPVDSREACRITVLGLGGSGGQTFNDSYNFQSFDTTSSRSSSSRSSLSSSRSSMSSSSSSMSSMSSSLSSMSSSMSSMSSSMSSMSSSMSSSSSSSSI